MEINENIKNIDKSSINLTTSNASSNQTNNSDIYSFVSSFAEVVIYDDLSSAPRVIKIDPAPTAEFIEQIASTTYKYSKEAGGKIPYTIIREVSENFIHARFKEVIVSILENGNTIRFTDQGPGIQDKEKAKLPGFTSANHQMKQFIRGVGSGLPIAGEYLSLKDGSINIDDNIDGGSVVTISLNTNNKQVSNQPSQHINQNTSQPNYQTNQYVGQVPDFSIHQNTNQYSQSMQDYPINQNINQYSQPALEYHVNQNASQFNQQVLHQFTNQHNSNQPTPVVIQNPPIYLPDNERYFLGLILDNGPLGVSDIVRLTQKPQSSVYTILKKLEELNYVEKTQGQKRILTNLGYEIAQSI